MTTGNGTSRMREAVALVDGWTVSHEREALPPGCRLR